MLSVRDKRRVINAESAKQSAEATTKRESALNASVPGWITISAPRKLQGNESHTIGIMLRHVFTQTEVRQRCLLRANGSSQLRVAPVGHRN